MVSLESILIMLPSMMVLVAFILQYRTLLGYKRTIDTSLQQAINDIAGDIASKFEGTFANPNVKRAMTILAEKGHDSRASKATIEQFKESLHNVDPIISLASEKLGMEPVQLLEIWNDPRYGPMVQGIVGKFAGPMLQNMTKGISQGSNIPSKNILSNPVREIS